MYKLEWECAMDKALRNLEGTLSFHTGFTQ